MVDFVGSYWGGRPIQYIFYAHIKRTLVRVVPFRGYKKSAFVSLSVFILKKARKTFQATPTKQDIITSYGFF